MLTSKSIICQAAIFAHQEDDNLQGALLLLEDGKVRENSAKEPSIKLISIISKNINTKNQLVITSFLSRQHF